jgi:hypothetical protein
MLIVNKMRVLKSGRLKASIMAWISLGLDWVDLVEVLKSPPLCRLPLQSWFSQLRKIYWL